MTDISSVSQSELVNRRRQLRQQRRLRLLQTIWQVLALGSMAGGLVWGLSQIDWMLRRASQVTIEGNKVLSADTIRSILPIHYPQSILTLQPQVIAQRLETEAPIADATVTRRLFPPGLTVRIQERYPVAVVYMAGAQPAPGAKPKPGQKPQQQALLDEEGAWIPYDVYVALNPTQKLPGLKVLGMREEYRSHWASLYEQISRSPVKISEIDWRNPADLVLKTELGLVHFGSYSPRFSEQLKALDQLRDLPKQVSLDQISYIDLRNPEVPLVEMNGKAPASPET
ncbi:MAG TPA: FtsQ-type POTRA domain-containing protein [Allocoleopsis sp.]